MDRLLTDQELIASREFIKFANLLSESIASLVYVDFIRHTRKEGNVIYIVPQSLFKFYLTKNSEFTEFLIDHIIEYIEQGYWYKRFETPHYAFEILPNLKSRTRRLLPIVLDNIYKSMFNTIFKKYYDNLSFNIREDYDISLMVGVNTPIDYYKYIANHISIGLMTSSMAISGTIFEMKLNDVVDIDQDSIIRLFGPITNPTIYVDKNILEQTSNDVMDMIKFVAGIEYHNNIIKCTENHLSLDKIYLSYPFD